ncbi:MAG: xylulokinase [bacterium]|nr:xylulokinase [bacterium]
MKFLGVDVGTGGSRAVAIDEGGAIIAQATVDHAPFASPHPGWSEQSPEDWWRAASEAIGKVLETVSNDEIGAVSFSGQMHGSVFLDEADTVIRPALLWNDQRTAPQVEKLKATIGDKKVIEMVANPAVTGFTLPKLLWVRENEPDNWNRIRTVLLPKDYVRLRLTGEKACDVADASGTLMFDVRDRCWSSEMLAAVEIDAGLLPRAVESIEATGFVSQAGSKATGLKLGTPVFAGAGDNAAGAIGAGLVSPGTLGATIGTSGVVFVVADKPTLDPQGRVHSLCHAIPGRWHMTGVTLAAGYSLKWFRDTFAPGVSYDELTSEAAKVPAGSEGLIWLPYLMGERSPHMDPNATASFTGVNGSRGRGHFVRAIMEGVAFSLRDSIDIFRSLGAPINEIRLGGGGASSPLWRQVQADVYGQPVSTLVADEGAAYGAALLAGVGTGAWPSVEAAVGATIRIDETVEPNPDNSAVLEKNYQRFRSLYPALNHAGNTEK